MKPDWNALGRLYPASASVLIGDVDCTLEKTLCSRFDVKGFPTLLSFDLSKGSDQKGEKYKGDRKLDALKKFVKEELETNCSLEDADATCTERELKYWGKMKDKGINAVVKQLKRLEGLKGAKLKRELMDWLMARVNILQQIASAADRKAETL